MRSWLEEDNIHGIHGVQLQPVLIEQGLQLCNLSTDYLAQG